MAEHPNVERVRRGYGAFQTGDLDTLTELFDENLVWHVPGNNPLSGDYKGRDEVFAFFGKISELMEGTLKFDIHDIVANDEHAVALVRGTAQRQGKSFDQNEAHIFHVNSEGKVTEFWNFIEDQAAADEFMS